VVKDYNRTNRWGRKKLRRSLVEVEVDTSVELSV